MEGLARHPVIVVLGALGAVATIALLASRRGDTAATLRAAAASEQARRAEEGRQRATMAAAAVSLLESRDANATALRLASIQEGIKRRELESNLTVARIWQQTQIATSRMQAEAIEGASTLNFWSSIFGGVLGKAS